MNQIVFPKEFLFGTATSASQIEGAAHCDGRGESIWDVFARVPGKITDGSTPENTCDFYHRFQSDLALAKQLHLDSFRFSFSWSRIFPEGTGKVNEKGLDFYKRLVEEIHKNGMIPNATLYHWDLPQALEEKGGWLNREIVDWYGEYASTLFRTFGKEIPLWATMNEPIATYVGYGCGIFAPGYQSEAKGRQANHNLLLAHGEGVRRFRAEGLSDSKIGIVVDIWDHQPFRPDNAEDRAIAQLENEKTFKSYLHPIFKKCYSDGLLRYMEETRSIPDIRPGDFDLIGQPLDFFGLNCYNRVVDCADKALMEAEKKKRRAGGNFQDTGDYYPKAVYDAIHILKEEYGLEIPIYITENGTAGYDETIEADGSIHDSHRIRYVKGFLYWLHKAMEEGADVRGYYVWSLLDNWEWTGGYTARFGLTHVDYETQKRTVKDSGKWYAQLAQTRELSCDPLEMEIFSKT